MITAPKLKAWSKAIASPAKEFETTNLSILEGEIPIDLRGTLYRNGPARLSRGKQRVGHWFDGDGAILRINFSDVGAVGSYRYVKTQEYLDEQQQDTLIYPNYGMTAPGAFWHNLFRPIKNAANTSVLALEDRLLALWEGGNPHALDLDTLATIGKDTLSALKNKQAFSAHPKVDPITKGIFNYGVSAGANATLNLYRCDSRGKLEQQNTYTLQGLPLIHDFCLAGEYLIFMVSPVRVNFGKVTLRQKSYSDSLEWKPSLGTEILIFAKEDLSLVSQGRTNPWFQWHFANGYINDQGNIVTEFTRYENFDTNQYLKEVASGYTETSSKGTLWSLIINPQTAEVISNKKIADAAGEFPSVASNKVGQEWRYTYLNVHRHGEQPGQELFNAIACFDRETSNMAIADMGKNCYPSEPIIVPTSANSEHGWLLTVVFDGNTEQSEVRIYQSDRLFESPVCRLALPSIIPPSFHGTWKQK